MITRDCTYPGKDSKLIATASRPAISFKAYKSMMPIRNEFLRIIRKSRESRYKTDMIPMGLENLSREIDTRSQMSSDDIEIRIQIDIGFNPGSCS